MTNPMFNLIEGVRLQAEARELKLADVQAKMKLEQATPTVEATPEAVTPEEIEAMSPEQMQEAITLLSSAVMELTNRLDGGK